MGIKVKPIYKCPQCGALYDETHTVAQCQKQERTLKPKSA